MAVYEMQAMLEYSRGIREASDLETIKSLIAGCVSVEKTNGAMDRAGVDYIARLRGGALIQIDAKTRTPGCSRYWRDGPELALELWSVRPESGYGGKAGWTVCEAKSVEYILFTFDPADSDAVFLYPYQLLRTVFHANYRQWKAQGYKIDIQESREGSYSWTSECIFVPEAKVWAALRQSMMGNRSRAARESKVSYVLTAEMEPTP